MKKVDNNTTEKITAEEKDRFERRKRKARRLLNQKDEDETQDSVVEVKDEEEAEISSDSNKAFLKSLKEWVVPILLAIIVALLFRGLVGGATTVQGQSMEPTLLDGDVLYVSKLPTYTSSYERMDIIILDPPLARLSAQAVTNEEHFVKRIIGLPGEKVEIKDGLIYIDGLWLREYYLKEPLIDSYLQSSWQLGANEYFVLGDNRGHGMSNDSRLFGPIRSSDILGVVRFRIWPLNRIGGI